jgi:hypothetical protein
VVSRTPREKNRLAWAMDRPECLTETTHSPMQQCLPTPPPSISPGERFLSRPASPARTLLYNGVTSDSNPRNLYLQTPPNCRICPHSSERPAPDLHCALVLTRTGLRSRRGVGAHIGYGVNSWVVMREGGVGGGGSDREGHREHG